MCLCSRPPYMFEKKPHWNLFKATSDVVVLSRSGNILAARKLFDEMPQRDSTAFNAMITSYSHSGLSQEALSLFSLMRISGLKPDPFSFTAALHSSSQTKDLNNGRKLHGLIINFGYLSSLPVCNSLLDMYAKCSFPCSALSVFNDMSIRNELSWCSLLYAYVESEQLDNAKRVFDELPKRTDFAYNILIRGFSLHGELDSGMGLFKKMQLDALKGDLWTFTSLMNVCSQSDGCLCGLMIHALIIKSGWSLAVDVSNSVLSFYAKTSCDKDAVKMFFSIEAPTLVSWNAVIDAYMKVSNVEEALSMFQVVPEKNGVTWTIVIAGLTRNGFGEEALSFFVNMIKSLFQPDDITFGAALHACANLVVLEHGRMVHSSVIRHGFHSYVYVGNGLVNMYAKCGDIEGSVQAFNAIENKDLVTWNTMLFGLGLHGLAQDALNVYEKMVLLRVRPDKVTFIGLLMTCSHCGLVELGHKLFDSMKSVYGLPQEVGHLACVIDMLGRGGYLKEASDLIKNSSTVLGDKTSFFEALLSACARHGDVQLGRDVGKELLSMEPLSEMAYVSLSNLYCSSGQWEEGWKTRKAMAKQGVKKMPGCSWIEVRNVVMIFVAGDVLHPMMEGTRLLLELLGHELRN